MTWLEMRQRLFWLYYNRSNITYNLGCAGQVAGRDQIVENNFKYYWDHGWAVRMSDGLPGIEPFDTASRAWEQWLSINKNKMCFDCSGLICWVIGFEGVHKYSSWDFGSMPKQASPAAGVEMSALWKQGHVGVDIGAGYCMEIGTYNNTIEFNKISLRGWQSSHLITGIDYTGADNR